MKQEFTPEQFENVFEMVVFMKYSPSVIADHLEIERSLFSDLLTEAQPKILEKLREVNGIILISGSSIIPGCIGDVFEPHSYEWLPDRWKNYVEGGTPQRIRCFIECKKRDHNCYCEMKTRELQKAARKKEI